ncbi:MULTISPECIES: DUF3788 domain-containing protein [unclassified Clostridium]|uniref:DUF3788 domain-containing protein n=1 Tax=unclassified Clostridium TaxID=2614128 RepID=UPI0002979B27|nr:MULTISPECIES: DUF3788 domain-containing protein [unclassified Clostridium]EKQ54449.1 MAG: hypothetical protein A370_03273 [Clostridium sp. Maddingley MBC34-26]
MCSNLYLQDNQPSWKNIKEYVNSELFHEFCSFVENTYSVIPKMEYSKCSMQKGWNIKYKKSGKSLCTLYPMEHYFIVLIVIGEKERQEVEFMLPTCSKYIQKLYIDTGSLRGIKWLMIEVKEKLTLEDVIKFIKIRASNG